MSRTRLLVWLLVICFVAAYAYLGTDYGKQRRQQTNLKGQMQSIGETLALLPQPPANLEQRLAQAQQDNLNAKKKNLVLQQTDTTKVIENIFRLGDNYHLKIAPLTTDPWSDKSDAGHKYRVFSISMNIEGTLSDLMDFIKQMEDSRVAAVENLVLTPTDPVNSAEPLIIVTATLDIALVTQSEDTQ